MLRAYCGFRLGLVTVIDCAESLTVVLGMMLPKGGRPTPVDQLSRLTQPEVAWYFRCTPGR